MYSTTAGSDSAMCEGNIDLMEEDDSESSRCGECGREIKTKRAMLAHLDKHSSIPASCRSCRRTFNSLAALKYHQEAFCGRRKAQCPQCKVFMPSTCYNSHVEAHRRNNCRQCPSLFTNRKHLATHMAEVHNILILADAAFPCTAPNCWRHFVKRSTLFHHLQLRHAAPGVFVCLTCGTYVKGKEAFDAHVAVHKKWTCEECDETFTRRQQYLVHKIRHEENKYMCVTCNQNFPTKSRALEHRGMGHEVTGLSEKGICSECGELFYTKQELRSHIAAHKVNNSVTCDCCGKTFPNQKAFTIHKWKTHKSSSAEVEKKSRVEKSASATDGLICEQCGKPFKNQHILDKHIKYVHREKHLVCSFCDYRTKYDLSLRRHLALHTSHSQQFVCDQCGASFKALSALKDHYLFVHSDERNFQCEKCSKSFKRRNDLNRHLRSHSDQREYVCHCKQTYKFVAHLRRHQKSAHKDNPLNRENRVKLPKEDNPSAQTDPKSDAEKMQNERLLEPPSTVSTLSSVTFCRTPHDTLSCTEANSFSSNYGDLNFVTSSVPVEEATIQANLHLQLPIQLSQFELGDQVEHLMRITNGDQSVMNSMSHLDHDVVFGSSHTPNQLPSVDQNSSLMSVEHQDSVLVSLNVAKSSGLGDDCGGLNITCGNDQGMVSHADMATMTEFMNHQLGIDGTHDVSWSGDLEEGLALSVFN